MYYDWVNSPGSILPFVYDEIEGFIEIIDYITDTGRDGRLIIKYADSTKEILPVNLRRCKIGDMIGKQFRKFFYQIGEVVKDSKRDMTIIDLIRKKASTHNARFVRYKCNICGYESSAVSEDSFIRELTGCGCCSGKVLVPGMNDIATVAPWMVCYFIGGENEAKNYTANSIKKLKFICTYCGRTSTKETTIRNLYRQGGLNCCCRQKLSYPEKVMWNVLENLKINFEHGYSPNWSRGFNGSNYPCEFDFFLPNHNIIIEMDGGIGHGKYVYPGSKLSAEETKNKDMWKDMQAELQGISVIRIESNKSTIEYLRQEITRTLDGIFDLSEVNWAKCHEGSLKSDTKEISEYYEINKPICLTDLAKHFNVTVSVIRRHIKNGTEVGWCTYDASTSNELRKQKASTSRTEFSNEIRNKIVEFYEQNKALSKTAIAKSLGYHRTTVGKHLKNK